MIIHGVAYFQEEEKEKILSLARIQSSCARSAYQARHKFGLSKRKDLYAHLKRNYNGKLKSIQIYDAIDRVSGLKNEGVIFGGKKNWEDYLKKKISKEEWKDARDGQYYASGDTRNFGNRSVRIHNGEIKISSPTEFRKYMKGKIFIPKKWAGIDFSCFNIRIRYDGRKFRVQIYMKTEPTVEIHTVSGSIGVDINPSGYGVTEVNGDGNLSSHRFFENHKIRFASTDKRTYEVHLLAKEVVSFALEKNKPIVLEKLNFKNTRKKKEFSGRKGSPGRKFNRMRGNFIYRKALDSIRSRANKFGVPVIEVNPAHTSILGNLKYSKMHSLNRHTAAALVIGRRGIGILERMSFAVKKTGKSGDKLNLAGRGFSQTLSQKSWSFLQIFLKENKQSLSQSQVWNRVENPAYDLSSGEIPLEESILTTGQNRHEAKCFMQQDEKIANKLFQSL